MPCVSGAWKMKPSNCISRTPANSGRAVKVASAKSQTQSVRSRKPTCGVEVGTDLPVFRFKVEPVGAEVQSRTQVGLPALITGCACLSSVTVQNEILE